MARKPESGGSPPTADLVRHHDVDETKNIKIHPGWVIAAPFLIAALIVLVVILVGWLSS